MLRGVLLDVGGTLWPEHGPSLRPDVRAERILVRFANLAPSQADALLESLARAPAPLDGGRQDSHAYLAAVAADAGVHLDPDEVERLRQALCLPASIAASLFPDADTLLRRIRALGLRCAIVSNALFRTGADYRVDFEHFGLAECITAYVTSLDVRMRKPHPLMFERALRLIDGAPGETVMIGDNERNDIAAARALGMRTIRVAIETPPPAESLADAVATDLRQVSALLDQWAGAASRT